MGITGVQDDTHNGRCDPSWSDHLHVSARLDSSSFSRMDCQWPLDFQCTRGGCPPGGKTSHYMTRADLVHIFCSPAGLGPLMIFSGMGVINLIDYIVKLILDFFN